MNILDKLGRELIFFDGAMGSLLLRRGLRVGEVPEKMNLDQPETVTEIHREYLRAGCDCLTTNTFGANGVKLAGTGISVNEAVEAAVACAKRAIADVGGKRRFVALDIGPTGKLLEPFGELSFEDAVAGFAEAAVAGERSGADLVIIETMTDTYEAKAAVLAVKENTSLPVFASLSFDEDGRLLTGGSVECAVALLEGMGVDAIGVNCGFGPQKMREYLREAAKYSSLPLIMMPNAGMPRMINGEVFYDVSPESFALEAAGAVEDGACVLGGCCGTTPEYISAVVVACRDKKPLPITEKNITVVSSYAEACSIGEKPAVIGERINPTGKKKFKEALRAGDFGYIVSQGIEQREDGAHILDVNVGLPDIDEKAACVSAVKGLQELISLPLQLDTADPDVMAAALRLYNGKAMINSVNGKREVMEKIFPLAKKYGGVVVALTLDEDGIPPTALGRLAVAEKILKTAEEFGIKKKDLVFDALTMAVSASPDAAKITLQSLALIKEKLGVKTVLGVSNVSFGLPDREAVNTVFLAEALHCGLDAAILNPSSEAMMNVVFSHNVLAELDEQCGEYISRFSSQSEDRADEETVFSSVLGGRGEAAYRLAAEQLKSVSAQQLIEGQLMPALDEVGRGFENKTLFLPQLIKSAAAAQSAFSAVRESLGGQEKTSGKGAVVLATVEGDIHDIGKSIVRVMFENYGYDVVDLGRDVSPETVVDAVEKSGAGLVGLSALMTTTVPAMERTIELIRERGLDCRVVVGGAVLTEEAARAMGADCYAPSAMEGIRYAQNVFK